MTVRAGFLCRNLVVPALLSNGAEDECSAEAVEWMASVVEVGSRMRLRCPPSLGTSAARGLIGRC